MIRCQECGRGFTPRNAKGRFCGPSCRWAAWRRRKEEAEKAQAERIVVGLIEVLDKAIWEARGAP